MRDLVRQMDTALPIRNDEDMASLVSFEQAPIGG